MMPMHPVAPQATPVSPPAAPNPVLTGFPSRDASLAVQERKRFFLKKEAKTFTTASRTPLTGKPATAQIKVFASFFKKKRCPSP
jgi:hypothetical protein